ncbi:heavy metal-binding domain-containing protein [Sulfitobacter sp. KE29]|nr:heavy metal-binding domain-containing protein [Sulfitobacter sp. Ks38]MDF3427675.1 heavy metal-binding domain-containing protein [Sulfitobacter sp. KE29]MDF3431254.1 heavy metal-binding domain-containing protein [Sulfitobacter sp. S46]MDF3446027.1 heavy metal-binding domain-containing protein [Sulfitobacter sp. KE31]MDF3550035.1 heavy metal-binding domain-containing protein [Sulfitobacter sp. KE28]
MAECAECGKVLTSYNRRGNTTCKSCTPSSSGVDQCEKCGKSLNGFNRRGDGNCRACGPNTSIRGTGQTRKSAIEAITVTTETYTDLVIETRLGIVTAECAYGMNAFKDLFASVRNIFGGRSEAVQSTMRDARETVLYELKQEAHRLGADAVVAVDLDYVQIGDGGWSMVMLVASGTAVKTTEHPSQA